MKKTNMVVGFVMTNQQVLLVRKNRTKTYEGQGRPAWMNGLLNGLGGVMDDAETPLDTLMRKVLEEGGISSKPEQWQPFHAMNVVHANGDTDFIIFARMMTTPQVLSQASSPRDEEIGLFDIAHLNDLQTVPNLKWLIPMAQQAGEEFMSSSLVADGQPLSDYVFNIKNMTGEELHSIVVTPVETPSDYNAIQAAETYRETAEAANAEPAGLPSAYTGQGATDTNAGNVPPTYDLDITDDVLAKYPNLTINGITAPLGTKLVMLVGETLDNTTSYTVGFGEQGTPNEGSEKMPGGTSSDFSENKASEATPPATSTPGSEGVPADANRTENGAAKTSKKQTEGKA